MKRRALEEAEEEERARIDVAAERLRQGTSVCAAKKAAAAARIEIREAAARVRAAIAARLGRPCAPHRDVHGSLRIQAAARGYRVRRMKQINIFVEAQDGTQMCFRMKKTTRLSKLMHTFCQRQGVSIQSLRFFYGQRINEHQTPQELGMEDGDIIDVMIEQQGD